MGANLLFLQHLLLLPWLHGTSMAADRRIMATCGVGAGWDVGIPAWSGYLVGAVLPG